MDAFPENLKRLRKVRNLTQAQLADLAKLPRATLAGLEQPGANPSLASAAAIAAALDVSLDELVTARAERRHIVTTPAEQQEFQADHGRFRSRLLSPISAKGVQINLVHLDPGCRSIGRPHPEGAQEFYFALDGETIVQVEHDAVTVAPGHLVQFPGQRRHTYINRGTRTATAMSVVVMPMG